MNDFERELQLVNLALEADIESGRSLLRSGEITDSEFAKLKSMVSKVPDHILIAKKKQLQTALGLPVDDIAIQHINQSERLKRSTRDNNDSFTQSTNDNNNDNSINNSNGIDGGSKPTQANNNSNNNDDKLNNSYNNSDTNEENLNPKNQQSNKNSKSKNKSKSKSKSKNKSKTKQKKSSSSKSNTKTDSNNSTNNNNLKNANGTNKKSKSKKTKSKTKNNVKKPSVVGSSLKFIMFFIILGVIAIIGLFVLLRVYNSRHTTDINLADYAIVDYDTTQTSVTPTLYGNWTLYNSNENYDNQITSLVDSGIYTKRAASNLMPTEVSLEVEQIVTGYSLSNTDSLSSGDTVTATIEYDNNKAEDLKLNVTNDSFDFTIVNLQDAIDIDLANYAIVSYDTTQTSVTPTIYGNWNYSNESDEDAINELVATGLYTERQARNAMPDENSELVSEVVEGYQFDSSAPFTNGEEVTVTIDYNQDLANELGINVTNDSFDITINCAEEDNSLKTSQSTSEVDSE